MNVVNCYNKNDSYGLDFRQILEEDEYSDYEKWFSEKNITFTDIAKEPSSTKEIITRAVGNYLGTPETLKYLIVDIRIILDGTSENLLKLKAAIKEYAEQFEYMFIIERGGELSGELNRNSSNGKNYFLFTEVNNERLIKNILDTIIDIEEGHLGKRRQNNSPKVIDNSRIAKVDLVEDFEDVRVGKDIEGNIFNKKNEEELQSEGLKEGTEKENCYMKEEDGRNDNKKKDKKSRSSHNLVRILAEKTAKNMEKSSEKKRGKTPQSAETIIAPQIPSGYSHDVILGPSVEISHIVHKQEDKTVREMLYERQREARKNIHVQGNVNYFTKERLDKAVNMGHILGKRKKWHSTNNVIIVRGLYENVSATYISIMLANGLGKSGASVVYINTSHKDFTYTVENYGIEKQDSFYSKNNILFLEEFMSVPDVNFYIIDSKEPYYEQATNMRESGFLPYYIIVVGGDAKGIEYLRSEKRLMELNAINGYKIIIKNLNSFLAERIFNEVKRTEIIEYQFVDNEPFSEMARNSSTCRELYRTLEELDNLLLEKEMEEEIEYEEEI